MFNNSCDICINPKRVGIDQFVFSNEYGILVINSRSVLKINNCLYKTEKRFSFAIHEHRKSIPKILEEKIKCNLSTYFEKKIKMNKNEYDFFLTMNTCPDHWHIHICLLPLILINKFDS